MSAAAPLPCSLDEAERFLTLLDESAEAFTFQTFDDSKQARSHLARILHGPLEQHREALQWLNDAGAGIFVTVNETDGRGRRAENIIRVRAVWQDDDGDGTTLPLEPHIVVETSPGKHHRYLLVDGLTLDEHAGVQSRLVSDYGSDPNAADLSRVLRLPGFLHRKYEPHPVRIVHESGRVPYTREELLAALPPTIDEAPPPQAHPRTEGPIPEGARNKTLLQVAGAMRRHGCGEQTIAAALQAENVARCVPPMSAAEVSKIARSAARYEPNRSGGVAVQEKLWPAPLDLRALARIEPHAPAFIVDEWLPAGYATLLAGHGGAGKSAVALYLAVCIAMGLPWMGIDTQRRRVLFVSCEDRADVLHWRLSRICCHLGIDMASLAGHLEVLDLVGIEAILWTPRVIDTGEPSLAYCALREAMASTGAEVLMLDGISDTYGGGENVRAEVRAFIASLLALVDHERGAVLLLGHVDKATANTGSTSNGYSGSTAWHNSVRARWYLYPETRHDGETTERTGDMLLEHKKSNHGESGQTVRLHWDSDAHLFVGQLVGGETALDRKARDRRERTSILAAMRAVLAGGDYVPAATTGNRTAFHVLSARPEFDVDRMPSTAAGRRRFWRHIEQLRAMGEIREGSIARSDRHRTTTLELASSIGDSVCGHAGNE